MNAFENKKECKLVLGKGPFWRHSQSYGEKKTCGTGAICTFLNRRVFVRHSLEIVKQYYAYFNQQDWEGMLSLVHPDLRHEPNQGEIRIGKEAFKAFLRRMEEAYEEKLTDMVFFTEPPGSRIAVEFTVNGIYKKPKRACRLRVGKPMSCRRRLSWK